MTTRAAACSLLLIMLAAAPQARAQNTEAQQLQQVQQLLQKGDAERAETVVNAYVTAHPRDARGRFLQGLVLGYQNRIDESIAVYLPLTQEFPELPEPHNNLAVLYAIKGQYENARAALEMAIRAQPSYATAHENLGDIYVKLAAQSYARAIAAEPGRASARQKLKIATDLVPAAPAASSTTSTGSR